MGPQACLRQPKSAHLVGLENQTLTDINTRISTGSDICLTRYHFPGINQHSWACLIYLAPTSTKRSSLYPPSAFFTIAIQLRDCGVGYPNCQTPSIVARIVRWRELQQRITMAATCGTALSGARLDSKLGSSFRPLTTGPSSSSSCGINNGAFRAVEVRIQSMPVRKSLQVVAMAPPKPGKAKKGIRVFS